MLSHKIEYHGGINDRRGALTHHEDPMKCFLIESTACEKINSHRQALDAATR
jgi:hypothetical protein